MQKPNILSSSRGNEGRQGQIMSRTMASCETPASDEVFPGSSGKGRLASSCERRGGCFCQTKGDKEFGELRFSGLSTQISPDQGSRSHSSTRRPWLYHIRSAKAVHSVSFAVQLPLQIDPEPDFQWLKETRASLIIAIEAFWFSYLIFSLSLRVNKWKPTRQLLLLSQPL